MAAARSVKSPLDNAALWAGCLLLPCAAAAMQPLNDTQLADVSGHDGISVVLSGMGIGADSVVIHADPGTPDAGTLRARDIRYTPLSPATSWLDLSLDAGARDGDGYLSLALSMAPTRFEMAALDLGNSTRHFGSWTLDGRYDFLLQNQGLFRDADPSEGLARLRLSLDDAHLGYRPTDTSSTGISLDNLHFLWDLPAGTVSLTEQGLRVAGQVDYALAFDWRYQDGAHDLPLLHLGWQGRLYDTEVLLGTGGVWDGTEADGQYDTHTRTDGLHLNIGWNYNTGNQHVFDPEQDMRWRIGRVGDNRMALDFMDWRNLQDSNGDPVPLGFSFPLTFDVVPAGAHGPGGLCWGANVHGSGCSAAGGQYLSLVHGQVSGYPGPINRSDGDTLMILLRDGQLLAYASQVRVDPLGAAPQDYRWGLIYTLPNINANIALYPGGNESSPGAGSRHHGFMADILLMSQTFAGDTQGYNWANGAHFMIADTCEADLPGCDRDVNMGIGFMGSSFLLAADDTRIWIRNMDDDDPESGGIDLLSPRTRMQFSGLLGMARLPDGADVVRIAGSDLNLEGLINFRLSPPPAGAHHLAYSAAMRLEPLHDAASDLHASGQGSWYSIYEAGRPDVALTFADLRGDITLEEGRLEVLAAGEKQPGSPPSLTLSNQIRIGASAAPRLAQGTTGLGLMDAGQVLRGDVYFGGNRLGEIVIPGATLRSTITLVP
ncbi:DUF6160 family protein [Isoalcanivorax indicus]|uniref:DUF6160 family protein n=1 Tax=Isoalcanivorax indicus TaxID=2202653 RepID=UPI0013C51955|nr:DUF6160 family protein [Isoalcanivorax indicus]